MHINAFLHWRNLLVDPSNVQERLHITLTQNGREAFAERRKTCNAAPHLDNRKEKGSNRGSKVWYAATHLAHADKDFGDGTIEGIG
jgi:hypothetical protein